MGVAAADGRLLLLLLLSVHDYKHLGVSNNFLVTTEQELAIQFNHQSCLEVRDAPRIEECRTARECPTVSHAAS